MDHHAGHGTTRTDDPAGAGRAIGLRSVATGLAGVLFICTLTPYNNYVLNNTDFVGNHLPASLLIFYLLIVLLINAPLRRWRPRWALTAPQLTVAMAMTLVGCALPSVGLMRYLPGHLVAPFGLAAEQHNHAELLRQLDLPDWMWPRFDSADPVPRGNEPVVREFFGRADVEEPTLLNRVAAVPWALWVRPAISWGIFFGALFGAALCMTVIFRRQWVDNERLAFPLATVYLSLLEPPEPGRALNRLLGNRMFWIACGAVFLLHGLNALSVYDPKHFPAIPLSYDVGPILSDEPWVYTSWRFKTSQVYFTIIGIMFFVQARVAFSLWFFFILMEVVRMVQGMRGTGMTGGMEQDQMFGATLVLGLTILWIARRHLAMVLRQMFRGARPGEVQGRYLPYVLAGWGFTGCAAAMVIWLVLAGASVIGALVIIALLMLVYVVVTRIVAETGLLYVFVPLQFNRPWLYAGDLSGGAIRTSLQSNFFGQYFFGMLLHDTRETPPVYISHALRVADEHVYAGQRNWRRGIWFALLLFLTLMLAFVVAGGSTLFAHYNFATTQDHTQQQPIGTWGSWNSPRIYTMDATLQYVPPRQGPVEGHSRTGHLLTGAGITAFLSVMNLRYAAWPLHPAGYLMVNTWGLRMIWFSIFLGWIAKTLITRYGGATLFMACRPLFLGLIFGEAAALVFWLSVSMTLAMLGHPYHAIHVLPI